MPNFIFGDLADNSKPFESTLNSPYVFYTLLYAGYYYDMNKFLKFLVSICLYP